MSKITIHFEIELDELKSRIEEAASLDDNADVFAGLADVYRAKKDVDDLVDQVKSIEADLKAAINSRAKALYGPAWEAIKGDNYKITRSKTGPVYNVVDPDAVDPLFVEVKFAPVTKAIEEFIKAESKLPPGIDRNPSRGEMIRVTVNTDENDQT